MAWRYGIAPASQFERAGLHMKPERYPGRAFRSTRGEGPPFGLPGTERATTEELATAFVRRFRSVALEGRGPDPAYAAWFEDLLGTCEPDGLPVLYADGFDAGEHGIMVEGADAPFRLPPSVPRE